MASLDEDDTHRISAKLTKACIELRSIHIAINTRAPDEDDGPLEDLQRALRKRRRRLEELRVSGQIWQVEPELEPMFYKLRGLKGLSLKGTVYTEDLERNRNRVRFQLERLELWGEGGWKGVHLDYFLSRSRSIFKSLHLSTFDGSYDFSRFPALRSLSFTFDDYWEPEELKDLAIMVDSCVQLKMLELKTDDPWDVSALLAGVDFLAHLPLRSRRSRSTSSRWTHLHS